MNTKNSKKEPILTKGLNGQDSNQIDGLSIDHIKALIDHQQLSPGIAESFLQQTIENHEKSQALCKFIQQNPNYTKTEIESFANSLIKKTMDEQIEEAQKFAQFHNELIHNWEKSLEVFNKSNKQEIGFFNEANIEDSFGMSRQVTDLVSRLKEILETSQLIIENNMYIIHGEIKDSYGNDIILKYKLNTSNQDEADKLHKTYKAIMTTKGLKIFMGCWKKANEHYGLSYSCPMIEIMKITSSQERISTFSVKEKQEHWDIIKMLEGTILYLERNIQKGKKGITQWIEQRLLEVLGGEKEKNNLYPDIIAINVLKLQPDIKFFPAIFKNNTLGLHPNDVFLAFYIQNRASQFNKGESWLTIDWQLLYYLSGLQQTSTANKRLAKSKIKNKIKALKTKSIIEEWSEYPDGIRVMPKSQKKLLKNNLTT